MQAPELLESHQLRLRRTVPADAGAIFESYAQDPEVTRFLTWRPPTSVLEVGDFLTECDRLWDEGRSFSWAITLGTSNRPVGMIEARVDRHRVELGYVVARHEWGRGIATEAVQTVVGRVLEEPTIWRVWAYTDVDNAPSGRVLEKAGMVREGLLRNWACHPNLSSEPRDCWVYSVCRDPTGD